MPSPTQITVAQLSRLIGLPGAPVLADVRTDQEYKSDPRLIPTAQRHPSTGVESWCTRYAGNPIVVVCQNGVAAASHRWPTSLTACSVSVTGRLAI